ncbi:MAG: PQ-loop domain-containing transporter [Candidatus Colwellbacteria bacterium]|nr:PQ-loop domain-containing transporter [Candidatus Colwellbacteria bacterium]
MTVVPEYGILLIGYAATLLSMIYRFPQIYQLYKTKKGDDISIAMIVIQQLSYILAILYGALRIDYVYITGSSISFLQNVLILYMRRKYSYARVSESSIGDCRV